MLSFLAIVHIIIAIVLILFVLLQDPKGGAAGMFGGGGGGGSQSLFGSTGATTFLNKLTRWTAIIFAGTCVFLTAMTSKQDTSVIDDYIPEPATEAEAPMNLPEEAGLQGDTVKEEVTGETAEGPEPEGKKEDSQTQ